MLDHLEAIGLVVRINGEKLRVEGELTDQLREAVVLLKPEILEALRAREAKVDEPDPRSPAELAEEAMAEAFTPGEDWEVNPLAERLARAGGWVGLSERHGAQVADQLWDLSCQWLETNPTHEAVRSAIAEHFDWTLDLAEA
jgi:hypothetical protein